MKTTGSSETSASNYKTTRFKNQENHKIGIPYVGSLKCLCSRRTFLVTVSPLPFSLVSVQSHVLPLPPFRTVKRKIWCTNWLSNRSPPLPQYFWFLFSVSLYHSSIHTFSHLPSILYNLCY